MKFIENLRQELSAKHLLKHPFYQLWTEGKLNQPILADYAAQYYPHVKAFPCYLSAIHSQCEDMHSRQILLENLIEEERGAENHPKLWRDFANALGVSQDKINSTKPYKNTQILVDTFFDLCRTSYAHGLGALYAYEHQTPEISESKIDGLKKFYNIHKPEDIKFFEVHSKADIWHSDEVGLLIEKLDDTDRQKARAAAHKACDVLWGFLDGIPVD